MVPLAVGKLETADRPTLVIMHLMGKLFRFMHAAKQYSGFLHQPKGEAAELCSN